jgi:MFS family permease
VRVGAIALVGVMRYLPAGAKNLQRKPVDLVGAVLVTAAAMIAIYGLVEAGHTSWTAPAVRTSLAVALILGVLFIAVESQRENALLPIRMLRIRSLLVTSIVRSFMVMGLYGVFFLATLDMSGTLKMSPLEVGLAFLPQTLTVAVLSLGVTATLVRRFGPVRVMIFGLAVAAIGLSGMAMLAIDEPYFPLRALLHVVLGLGFGSAFLPLLTLAMGDVPPQDAGLGSAIVNLSMQLAGAVSIPLLMTAASYRTRSLIEAGAPLSSSIVHGYRFAYVIGVVGILVGLSLGAALLRERKPV